MNILQAKQILIEQNEDPETIKQNDNLEEKDIEFIKQLCTKSQIITILGSRGEGKSALGFYLLEQLNGLTERVLATVGFPKKTPFKNYDKIEDVPNGSIILIDEGSMRYDARRSLSKENINMSNILKVARHNELSVILISQNSADVEVRTLRMTDIFLLKAPSLVQTYLERSFIKRLYQHISPIFQSEQDQKPYYYVFSDKLQGLFKFELPSFWSEDISKAHRKEKSLIPNLFANIKRLGKNAKI